MRQGTELALICCGLDTTRAHSGDDEDYEEEELLRRLLLHKLCNHLTLSKANGGFWKSKVVLSARTMLSSPLFQHLLYVCPPGRRYMLQWSIIMRRTSKVASAICCKDVASIMQLMIARIKLILCRWIQQLHSRGWPPFKENRDMQVECFQ